MASYKTWKKKYPELTGDRFAEMKSYILNHYAGVVVTNTFLESDRQIIDCVVASTQPGLRNGGNPSTAAPPPPVPPPAQNRFLPERSAGEPHTCREGTIPLPRIVLDDLARFKTVQGFLQKSEGERVPVAK